MVAIATMGSMSAVKISVSLEEVDLKWLKKAARR
jgi:hypothetical protein